MPPMTSLDEAPPEALRLLYRLARADPGDAAAFVPSLYRHLLHWPELLEVLEVLLDPGYEDGLIETAAYDLRADADALAATIDPDRAIAAASPTEARPVIDVFCSRIAEMLVICRLLEVARLPAPSG
jgi:hypothetical protein